MCLKACGWDVRKQVFSDISLARMFRGPAYGSLEHWSEVGCNVALSPYVEDKTMPANAVVRARIDKDLKEKPPLSWQALA